MTLIDQIITLPSHQISDLDIIFPDDYDQYWSINVLLSSYINHDVKTLRIINVNIEIDTQSIMPVNFDEEGYI